MKGKTSGSMLVDNMLRYNTLQKVDALSRKKNVNGK